MGFCHSLPLQLCADQSSVSLPGSGPKKMVLIFVPVIVLVWNWADSRTSNSFRRTLAGRLVATSLSSSVWENFGVGSVHCTPRFFVPTESFFF